LNPAGSNPSSKRRDKLFIIAEILGIAKEGTLKTQIMYRANLSFTQLNDYLKVHVEIDLLAKVLQNDKEKYKATAKGMDFLQRYHEITELLKSDDENKNDIDSPSTPSQEKPELGLMKKVDLSRLMVHGWLAIRFRLLGALACRGTFGMGKLLRALGN